MIPYDQLQLFQALQSIFRRQAQDVVPKVSLDSDDDFSHWNPVLVDVTRPHVAKIWRQGMVGGTRKLLSLKANAHTFNRSQRVHVDGGLHYTVGVHTHGHMGTGKGLGRVAGLSHNPGGLGDIHRLVRKSLGLGFNNRNPKIADAVDELVLKFCRETNKSMVNSVKETKAKIRELVAKGLARGIATSVLHAQIRKLFTDPARAFRITVTEAARASAAGEIMAWKDSGVVTKKRWLAGANSCDKCIDLEDLGDIPLDKPFHVDPDGGPYAITYHNPFHPHCTCQTLPSIG